MEETNLYDKITMVLDLYGDGLSLDSIRSQVDSPREDVLQTLRNYKKSQFFKGQYSDELMQLVADRDSSGAKRKDIMSELEISRSFLVRAIEEYGFLSKATDDNAEEFFMNVSEGFSFSECLKCGSKRVNDIQSTDVEGSPSGIYCMSCGSEFTLKDNIVKIVKWENID